MVVEGLVQGVGFRWFVARRAQERGLHGYVSNRYDGNVEIVAEGDRSLVEDLIKEVRVGPRSAHVSNLRLEWLDVRPEESPHTQFEIR
jgi:acylphosphatase